MVASTRLRRFADWTPLKPLCQSGRLLGSRPFYAGPNVDSRMDLVREAINYIRVHWDEYPSFMQSLRNLMQPSLHGSQDEQLSERAEALFSSVKEWSDRRPTLESDDYSAIRLYTSATGYSQMFQAINMALRQDDLAKQVDTLRAAVFLIELLNIDLFNYRGVNPHADGFEGCVYRGMCISVDELKNFLVAARGPIEERYLAIPLAMASASTNREKALSFALEEAERRTDGHPLLWQIHVVGLDPALLKHYLERFPTSVVSSICAVPIEQLSDYPDEDEVLLRGPFFQLLRLHEDHRYGADKPLCIVEAVMLTANRDHISSVYLSDADAQRARQLFRTLVTMQRVTVCAERAQQYGLSADAKAYRASYSAQQAILDALLH
jgi:hypothetical protein